VNGQTSIEVLPLPREPDARALVCAHAASRFEDRGEYERAVEALSCFWAGPGTELDMSGLSDKSVAALMLRAGSLTGWIGSKRQIKNWQETAKNLLSASAAICARLGEGDRLIEAQKHLALCYWREGAFAEARAFIGEALSHAKSGADRWLDLNLNLALIDFSENNFSECLRIYEYVATAVDMTRDDSLRARFHNGRGIVLKNTGDYDRAIIELTAACYYFDLSGHSRYRIATEINLANVCVLAGQTDEAHAHLDQAERLSVMLADDVHLAHAKDSRALAHLAEKEFDAAELAARASVLILEKGDEYALLVDSLVTHARTLANLSDSGAAAVYLRAYTLAFERVSAEKAGRVLLELVGELSGEACLAGHVALQDAKRQFEASIIRAALRATGKPTEAAIRLGIQQQTLSWILQNRHPELRPTTRRKTRREPITKPSSARSRKT